MGASGRSSGDDDGALLLRHPPPCSSQPTCWELPSTEDSKTPNPRPTKTMKMEESSDPPLPSSSEAVIGVDKEESSEEKPLPEVPSGAEPDVKKKEEEESDSETEEEEALWAGVPHIAASSPDEKKCYVCHGDHYTCYCTYFDRIPYGKVVANKDYVVVCECGGVCEDGGDCPTDYCLQEYARCVVPRCKVMGLLEKGAGYWG